MLKKEEKEKYFRMRRSAAPSVRSNIKKARFLPQVMKNISLSDKESNSQIPVNILNITSESSNFFDDKTSETVSNIENVRTNDDVLDLILETNSTIAEDKKIENVLPTCNKVNADKSTKIFNHLKLKPSKVHSESVSSEPIEKYKNLSSCIFCLKLIGEEASLFNVVWCKRSTKKHKTWEGDGFLIVKSRSAVLKDLDGKVLDKSLGYKLKEIESLEEGSTLFIGGKECEIQGKISKVEYLSGKYCKCSSSEESLEPRTEGYVKINKPLKIFRSPIFSSLNTQLQKEVMHDLDAEENIFILPSALSNEKVMDKIEQPIVDVYVDSFLTKQLRAHQKEGIMFMYKCIMGFQHEFGQGVILADEMGLGKTLQCIALIWTLYKRGPYGGAPVLKRVIIITPSSLVSNWRNEFYKWLGKTRLSIYTVDKKNVVKNFVKSPKPILIISYEMFVRSAELLSSVSFDLVVCDEGHRIKNLNIKISNVINCLSTTRRILLTGTPIQNDLAEFFSLVDFVNPGALGTLQSFRKTFERPINQSRSQECSESEKEYGEEKSQELSNITKMFMLRRTQEVINQYLSPKTETVIFCRPSELQRNLYDHLLKSRAVIDILSNAFIDTSSPLVYISVLRKLCNHPSLLYKSRCNEENLSDESILTHMESVFPPNYEAMPSDSGKMKVLEKMLSSLLSHNKLKEKVVIVSAFTKTLDILEKFCKLKHYEYLRLDGSTNSTSRQDIVDVFNRSYTKFNVFLLSSKAGGVGFNLIGASRIILFDIDWNPANDLQAMSRIWRDGQKHKVYVYRLLTTGTIEEKMYQRQISKQCLTGSVLDCNSSGKLRFSTEELKDLFTFHENTRCITHDLINCQCLSLENILDMDEFENNFANSAEKMKNIGMAELMNWNHICGPISDDNSSDFCLVNGGSDITFIFQNTTNARKCV